MRRIDAAYTPNLDSYLVPLIAGIKGPDQSLGDIQDKICDIFGPRGVMDANVLPLVSATEDGEEVTLESLVTISGRKLLGEGFETRL